MASDDAAEAWAVEDIGMIRVASVATSERSS
jgi:hypothetical protein